MGPAAPPALPALPYSEWKKRKRWPTSTTRSFRWAMQVKPSALVKMPCAGIWPLYHVPLYLTHAPVASVSYAAALHAHALQAPVSVGIDHLALTVRQPVDKVTVVCVAIAVPVRVLATARRGTLGLVTVGTCDRALLPR